MLARVPKHYIVNIILRTLHYITLHYYGILQLALYIYLFLLLLLQILI